MSDGLKVENVELLTDEISEDALAHPGAPVETAFDAGGDRRKMLMLKRGLIAAALLVCGAVSYPLAMYVGGTNRTVDAGQDTVVVGLHTAGREHKTVTVLSGGARQTANAAGFTTSEESASGKEFPQRLASVDDGMISPQKVSVVRDGSEQLVPRGQHTDNGEATNVKFDRVAANYKPRSSNSGVQVETPGMNTGGNSAKLDSASGGTKIAVPVSQGRLLRFDDEVESVFIADPTIADVKVLSTNEIYVFGKKPGITTMQAISGNKRNSGEAGLSASIQLYVGFDPEAAVEAKETIARSAPLSFSYQGDRMVVKGHARNVDEAVAGHEIAKNYSNGREPLDLAGVDGPNQVNIRVRFAEINRSELQGLGVDWGFGVKAGSFSLGVAKQTTTGLTPNITAGSSANTKGSIGNFVDINVLIEALQKNGMVNILAEPNLTAVTGETASFLAGGEVPIPVATQLNTNTTGGGAPLLSVMYKTFGVSLQFTPTLIKNGRIALRVKPEVSSVAGTSNFGVNGVNMPNFTVRRTDTVVEVGSGQTFALAGLFQREVSRNIEKFPVLGDVPVLGALFQSERFQRNETELVILITPYLVEPVSDKSLATPADKRTDQNTAMRPVRSEVDRPKPLPHQVDPGKSGFIYK